MGRLIDVARQKRAAILDGAGDSIVSLSESEETLLKSVLDTRTKRRAVLEEIVGVHEVERDAEPYVRQRLEEATPSEHRPALAEALSKYETRILDLRRAAKLNNVLLSDRILSLHHAVTAVLSAAGPKEEYEPKNPKAPRRKKGAGDPLVLDQKA
ncbi:flagellar export chaperone FlgN [bacterium]|nr:flagellar export chaperone FlgN [bacterium]